MEADEIRKRIADCDMRIAELIAERNGLANEMGILKKQTKSPVRVPDVERTVVERYVSNGRSKGISERTMEKIASALIEESVQIQENIINNER